MLIVQHSVVLSSGLLLPHLLLPAPRAFVARSKRLVLPAPKIAGYLPAPTPAQLVLPARSVRKVVVADALVEPPRIDINIYEDPEGWWAEFERLFGRIRSLEEMDAELEAKHPGYLAWIASRKAAKAAQA